MAGAQDNQGRPLLRLVKPGHADPELPDEELVRAFLTGDEEAFGALVRRYERLVYGLVRRYAARPEDCRDLSQKAFLRAFTAVRRRFPRMRQRPLVFKAWLVRIAVNVGKNHVRNGRRWRMEPVTALQEVPAAPTDAADRIEEAERRALAQTAVLRLPRRQREVLTLRVDGDLSFAEVAQALGITENNAKVHFHHAVKRLKALLQGEGT